MALRRCRVSARYWFAPYAVRILRWLYDVIANWHGECEARVRGTRGVWRTNGCEVHGDVHSCMYFGEICTIQSIQFIAIWLVLCSLGSVGLMIERYCYGYIINVCSHNRHFGNCKSCILFRLYEEYTGILDWLTGFLQFWSFLIGMFSTRTIKCKHCVLVCNSSNCWVNCRKNILDFREQNHIHSKMGSDACCI